MGLPWDAYYVLTKAEASLPNSKVHPNSGAPDYGVKHEFSDLVSKSHTLLDDIGTKTHAQLDSHFTDANAHTWANIDKAISSIADITAKSHTLLGDIGANTHAQIDTALAGLTSTSSPTFANLTISAMTPGSVLFANTGGLVSQDNANLFWDDANNRLGLRTVTPYAVIDVGGYGSVFSSGLTTPVALFYSNQNSRGGIEMKNDSTGTSADFRFALSDSAKNFMAFTLGGTKNTATDLFGVARNAAAYLFTYSYYSGSRHLVLGTYNDDDIIFGTNNTENMRILTGGNVGIGTSAPTARLHLPASTAAANTASVKINAGVLATTPVSGNIESDGTHIYWTDSGGTRRQLDN